MWLTRLAISRPILIWMALAAIAILGLEALFRLPAELNPRVDIPALTITTVYPGAGPAEIEAQVNKPLEEAVGSVGGVTDVFSRSQPNVSIISVTLQVGTVLETALGRVRERLDAVRAQLPQGVQPPVIAKLDINALPILYVGLSSTTLTPQQLRSFADKTLRPPLERVPGVAAVRAIGGTEREIHVSVHPSRLAQFGLTIEDVINSLKASGHDVPGGAVSKGGHETDVRLTASFGSLDEIRNTPLLALSPSAYPSAGGQMPDTLPSPSLTVGDVARVDDSEAEPTDIVHINGKEGVSLVFTKSEDANTVTVVQDVNKAWESLASKLPAGTTRVILRDDSQTVSDALQDVNISLVLGAVLAMTVVLLFLHNLRGTFIVSLAIPSCIVATFLVMYAAHFTLNQMTLLALSLSVGILVDDSIVVLESITRHLRQGEPPIHAALTGRAEIGFADLTTTLVDVVVFVPIAFMGGIVGGFFKQFGLTIASATLFSLIISFSVTPMLASRWYRSGEDVVAQRGFFLAFERLYRFLEERYRHVIRRALTRRWQVVASGAVALGIVFLVAFTHLGFEFLPGTDQGQVTVNIEMLPGTSLAATEQTASRVETVVSRMPDVVVSATTVGEVLGGFGSLPRQGSQFAQISIRLKDKAGVLDRLLPFGSNPEGGRTLSDEEIATMLRRQLQTVTLRTGGRITATAVETVEGIAAPIEVDLRGLDLNQMTAYAETLRDRMATIHGVLDPDISVRSGQPELRITVDPLRAAQYHVPSGMAGQILHDSIAGNTDSIFRDGPDDVPIRVQVSGLKRDPVGTIENLIVANIPQSPQSDAAPSPPITLGDIADTSIQSGPTNIDRSNGLRVINITSNLASDTPLGTAQRRIQAEIDRIPHPGIDIEWGGEAKTVAENGIYFASALILAIILVYIVMASLFNNLATPFVIMFTLPMALVGALGALVLTGQTLSLVSAIGVIMLVGLMGRNAILLLDYTNTLRSRGLARKEAIVEAGATRLRPILMTTTATIIGMLPVALRFGRASEVRAPMAIVVIGGLLVSTFLTLLVIPVLYSIFDDWFPAKLSTGVLEPGAPPLSADVYKD